MERTSGVSISAAVDSDDEMKEADTAVQVGHTDAIKDGDSKPYGDDADEKISELDMRSTTVTTTAEEATASHSRRSVPSRAAKAADSSSVAAAAAPEPRRSSRRRTPPPPITVDNHNNNTSATTRKEKNKVKDDADSKMDVDEEDGTAEDNQKRISKEAEEEEAEEEPMMTTEYTWLDEGTIPSRGGGGNIAHEALQIRQGDMSIVLRVGDSIFLRSGEEVEDEDDDDDSDNNERDAAAKAAARERALIKEHEAAYIAVVEHMWEEPPAVSTRRSSQQQSSNSSSSQAVKREHRMKIRTRWYFKRDDIASLKRNKLFLVDESSASLNISTHKELLKHMTDRDLILSDQCDDNDVLTILDKCRVVQRTARPLLPSSVSSSTRRSTNASAITNVEDPDPFPPNVLHSVYRCRFSLKFETGGRQHNSQGRTVLSAYQGVDEDWPTETAVQDESSPMLDRKIAAVMATVTGDDAPSTRLKESNDNEANVSPQQLAKHEDTSPMVSTEDELEATDHIGADEDDSEDNGDLLVSPVRAGTPGKHSAALGATSIHGGESERAGVIRIGPSYQAEVPVYHEPPKTEHKPVFPDRSPVMVWNSKVAAASQPVAAAMSNYWKGAAGILVPYMKFHGVLLSDNDAARGTLTDPNQPSLVREDLLDRSNLIKSISDMSTASVMMLPITPSSEANASEGKPSDTTNAEKGGDANKGIKMDVAVDEIGKVTADQAQVVVNAATDDEDDDDDDDALPTMLPRECNVDALLENLHSCNYNPDAALLVVDEHPQRFVTGWKKQHREAFNATFRRCDGIIHQVANALKNGDNNKTHKDIVDYHYRFKIPMQFRLYQEKKREDAIQMVEKLEQKRKTAFLKQQSEDEQQQQQLENGDGGYLPSSTRYGSLHGLAGGSDGNQNTDGFSNGGGAPTTTMGRSSKRRRTVASRAAPSSVSKSNWSRMSVQDALQATNERKQAAMQFLLNVGSDCGTDIMTSVATVIGQLPNKEQWMAEYQERNNNRNEHGETFEECERRVILLIKSKSVSEWFPGPEHGHLVQDLLSFLPEQYRH